MSPTTISDATTSVAERRLQELLESVDIELNGDRPWDPQVHDDRLYRRVWSGGSLALGEASMEGGWDCEALDQRFYRVLRTRLDREVGRSWRHLWIAVKAFFTNRQNPDRARRNQSGRSCSRLRVSTAAT